MTKIHSNNEKLASLLLPSIVLFMFLMFITLSTGHECSEVLGRMGTSVQEATCLTPTLVRHQCSHIAIFRKTWFLLLPNPDTHLNHCYDIQLSFDYWLLRSYIWKDFSTWAPPSTTGYGDRRFGFVFIGTDCLGNFSLRTKQITFENAVFSLLYPIWVVCVS